MSPGIKEIDITKEYIDQINKGEVNSISFQKIEEEFDSWTRWLMAIKESHENPLMARPVEQLTDILNETMSTETLTSSEYEPTDGGFMKDQPLTVR